MVKVPGVSKAQLNKAFRHEKKLEKRISAVFKSGDENKIRMTIYRYLSSMDSKLVAATKTIQGEKPRQKKKVDISKIIENLDPWEGSEEIVNVYAKMKSDNHNLRFVMDFGFEHRTLQNLILGPLKATLKTQPNQFLYNGGTKAAAREILKNSDEGLILPH